MVIEDQDPFARHVIVSNTSEACAHSTRSFECTLYMFPRTIRSLLPVVFGEPHAKCLISNSVYFQVTNFNGFDDILSAQTNVIRSTRFCAKQIFTENIFLFCYVTGI